MQGHFFGCVLGVVVALAVAGCGGGGDSGRASEPSVAQKLASIQKGSPASARDPLVRRFDRALDALQRKCKDRRIRLSDYTVRAQELLRKSGARESLESIITRVKGSIPRSAPKRPCADVFAAYVTLRKAG